MTYQENRNKGGRPKAVKGKARTKNISTRLTLAEWKAVMKRITDAGKKPSHFLRELLLHGKVEAARTQEDRQQIRMLEGGCNNLNQLAKMAHQQGFSLLKGKIVANRVDNDGNTISDSNDNVRNVKVCKALTREYGLYFSKGKMNVKRDRLRGKDKVKYQIYDAIKAALPCCNCWSDLCDMLAKQGIGVNFKYNRNEGKIIGVSFTKNEISFSGSRIDRSMSFYKLDKLFGSHIAEGMEWQPRVQEQPQPTRQDVGFQNNTADTFIREPSPAKAEADGNGSIPTEPGSNIVQVTIGTLMELCVQPHQAKVSSSGGGGGNESGWGDNDNEKDKHKPRRRKR